MKIKPCSEIHPNGWEYDLEEGHKMDPELKAILKRAEKNISHQVKKQHVCHAIGCNVAVKPELLMCLKHWRMVPREHQKAVWRHYRHGQCDDKRPSKEWHQAADKAIQAVREIEEALK